MLKRKSLTIAYPYKSSDPEDRELGVSINSMLRFFKGSLNFLIVGDKPKCDLPGWAEHVPDAFHPEPLLDAIRKIDKINSIVGTGQWIYCHDDMFAVKPFDLEHLETVLYTYYRLYTDWTPHNKWARAKKYTMRLLGADEVYDTATHRPRVFEVDKVNQVLELGKQKPGLWDFQIAYDELFTPPSKLRQVQEDGTFTRISKPLSSFEEAKAFCAGKTFLNTTTKGYNSHIEQYIVASDGTDDIDAPIPKPFAEERSFSSKLPIYTKCVHRGKETGETVKCGTCRALTSEQPVFECGVHGYATLRRPKKRHPTLKTRDCVSCFAEQQGFEKKEEAHAVG
jgi:hypothetical protein